MKLLLLLVLGSAAYGQQWRSQRGIMDEAEKIWHHLNTGIDNFQASARNDFDRMKPWADRVEQEMRPAVKQVEHTLGTAFNSMADQLMKNPLFGFTDVDREDNTPVVVQEHHHHQGSPTDSVHPVEASEESEEEEQEELPSSGPGLDDFFFNHFGGGSSGQVMNPFSIFGMSRRKQWWEGKNVCVDRKVTEDNPMTENREENQTIASGIQSMIDMTMTSCRDEDNFHECTSHVNTNGKKKKVVVKQQCCYGYTRSKGEMGCRQVKMQALEKTLSDMNGKEFLQLLESSGLKSMLTHNMTVFLPSDDAIEDFRRDLEKLNAVDQQQVTYNVDDGLKHQLKQHIAASAPKRSKRSNELTVVEAPNLADILKNHMVEGFYDSSLLNDEDVLNTTNADSKLRITVYNTYPQKVVMANCAKVTSKDHYATNGLVHTVDKVILPATKTIAEIIDSDIQFRTLAEALKKAKLMDTLSQPGQFTLFAPTDDAMGKLDQKTKAKVMAGNGCSQDILKHHLLPNVICSSVVESKAKTVNLLDKYMLLERKEDDSLYIDGKKIEMRDVVATNGVIQVLEEVLIPESARSAEEALNERGATTLHELFQLAGISEGLDGFANNTIFAPSEKALKALPKEFMDDLRSDKKKLQDFLMYHVATPKTCKCQFRDNTLLQSGLKDKQLRINTYDGVPFAILDTGSASQISTVQCARITELDDEICGGMIHTVEKVLLPPGGKAVEVIKNGGQFSKFMALVEFAELENELNAEGPFTVLAPTDTAFEHLDETVSKKAFSDKDAAVKLVHHHVLPEVVCCSGISRHVPFFDMSGHRTQSGEVVSLRKSRGGHIYADRSEITTCDMVADNGVVHALDRVLVPETLSQPVKEVASSRRNSPVFTFKLFK